MFKTNKIIFVNTEHLLLQWVQQWQSWLLDSLCPGSGKYLISTSDFYNMAHWTTEIPKNLLKVLGQSSKSSGILCRSKKARNNLKILAEQFPWIWTWNLRLISVKIGNWKGYVKLIRVNKPLMKYICLFYYSSQLIGS